MRDAQGQVRLGGMGDVAGLDMSAVMQMADAAGISRQAVAALMPDAERGMVQGLNESQSENAKT